MNTKRIILIGALAATMTLGAVAVIGNGNGAFEGPAVGVRAESVDFSTKTITRRFWFVSKVNDWASTTLHVKAYGGTLDKDYWFNGAVKVVSDYYKGIYYADITAAGIGGAVNIQVKCDGSDYDAYRWSNPIALPSLGDKTSDVLIVEDTCGDNGNRNTSVGTAGGNIGQVAAILATIESCSDSFAKGYNAYPQLNADFIVPSAGEIASKGSAQTLYDYTWEQYLANSKTYENIGDKAGTATVSAKINMLSEMFDTKGWTLATL